MSDAVHVEIVKKIPSGRGRTRDYSTVLRRAVSKSHFSHSMGAIYAGSLFFGSPCVCCELRTSKEAEKGMVVPILAPLVRHLHPPYEVGTNSSFRLQIQRYRRAK